MNKIEALKKAPVLNSTEHLIPFKIPVKAILNHHESGFWWYITEYSPNETLAFGYVYCHLAPENSELGYVGADIIGMNDVVAHPVPEGLMLGHLYDADRCDWCGKTIDFGADDASWGHCDSCGDNICSDCDKGQVSDTCSKCNSK